MDGRKWFFYQSTMVKWIFNTFALKFDKVFWKGLFLTFLWELFMRISNHWYKQTECWNHNKRISLDDGMVFKKSKDRLIHPWMVFLQCRRTEPTRSGTRTIGVWIKQMSFLMLWIKFSMLKWPSLYQWGDLCKGTLTKKIAEFGTYLVLICLEAKISWS